MLRDMIVKTTEGANRILNRNSKFEKAVYSAMKDIEIVLDGSFFNGQVVLDSDEKRPIFMNLKPTRHFNGVEDLCDQLNYLIQCNHELNLPLQYNGETFRYRV